MDGAQQTGPDRLREQLRLLAETKVLAVVKVADLRETLERLAKLEDESKQRLLFAGPIQGGLT